MIIGTTGAGAPVHGRGAGVVVSTGGVDDEGGCEAGTGWAPSAGAGVTDLFTGAGTSIAGVFDLSALFAATTGARGAGSTTAGEADGLAAWFMGASGNCDG